MMPILTFRPRVETESRARRPAFPAHPSRRLLVVDDLPDVLHLVRGLARRVPGMQVRVEAEVSSARAIRLLRESPFDLVVSDQRLAEDDDGLAVLAAAREMQPLARRVLMSGYEVPAPLDRVRAADVDAYLAKPFPASETIGLLGALLDDHPLSLALTRARARHLEASAFMERRPISLAPRRPSNL